MKALKIRTTDFTDASNGEFVNIFGEIIQAIIAHLAVFINLPYTPAQLGEKLQAITDKTNAAEEGSKEQKNDRDLERSECNEILFQLMAAVIARAEQAESYEEKVTIVELSKFKLYKTAEPVGTITPPTPEAKMSDFTNTIDLDWAANKGVKSWIVQHVAGAEVSPTANWETVAIVTRSRYTATGLSTGYHSFRLIAISATGASAPSEPVTEFAR